MFVDFVLLMFVRANPNKERLCKLLEIVVELPEILLKFSRKEAFHFNTSVLQCVLTLQNSIINNKEKKEEFFVRIK